MAEARPLRISVYLIMSSLLASLASASLLCPADKDPKCPACCGQAYASYPKGVKPSYQCSGCPPNARCFNPCPASAEDCAQYCVSRGYSLYFFSFFNYQQPSTCSCYSRCSRAGLNNLAVNATGAFGLAGVLSQCRQRALSQSQKTLSTARSSGILPRTGADASTRCQLGVGRGNIPRCCEHKNVLLEGTSILETRGSNASFGVRQCRAFCSQIKAATYYDFVRNLDSFSGYAPYRCHCYQTPEGTNLPSSQDRLCLDTCPVGKSFDIFPTTACPSTIPNYSKCCQCKPECAPGMMCAQVMVDCAPQTQCIPFWDPKTSEAFAGRLGDCPAGS